MSCARVWMLGNLSRDPELKYSQGGNAIAEFGIAVNERTKVNGEWADVVSFFDVTVFGNQAENCSKYLEKGAKVVVEGNLKQDRWEDGDAKRSRVKVIANRVHFVGGRKTERDESTQTQETVSQSPIPESEIPF